MVRSKKKDPLKDLDVMLKYANQETLIAEKKKTKITKEEASARKSASKAWYKTMISDSDYAEFGVFSKWLGVPQQCNPLK